VEVVPDPVLQVAQRCPGGALRGELGAELALAPGALDEHHELAGDGAGELGTVVGLGHGQGQVQAGGDPGRGPDVAVADEDRVRVDRDLRIPLREVLASGPVGDGPAAVQQSGLGQQERSAADRCRAPGPSGGLPEPGDQAGVLTGPEDPRAAHRDEGVDRPGGLRERRRRRDRETAAGGDGPGVGGDDVHCHARDVPPDLGEHFVRTGEVEDLEVREDSEDDASAGHDPIVAARHHGGNDKVMTIPARPRPLIGPPAMHCAPAVQIPVLALYTSTTEG
jgi:hypothetical protein